MGFGVQGFLSTPSDFYVCSLSMGFAGFRLWGLGFGVWGFGRVLFARVYGRYLKDGGLRHISPNTVILVVGTATSKGTSDFGNCHIGLRMCGVS